MQGKSCAQQVFRGFAQVLTMIYKGLRSFIMSRPSVSRPRWPLDSKQLHCLQNKVSGNLHTVHMLCKQLNCKQLNCEKLRWKCAPDKLQCVRLIKSTRNSSQNNNTQQNTVSPDCLDTGRRTDYLFLSKR